MLRDKLASRQLQDIDGLHLLLGTYDPSSALAVSTESANLQLSCLRGFARVKRHQLLHEANFAEFSSSDAYIADVRKSTENLKLLKHVYRICTVTLNDGSRLSQGSLDADTKLAAPYLINCADAAA